MSGAFQDFMRRTGANADDDPRDPDATLDMGRPARASDLDAHTRESMIARLRLEQARISERGPMAEREHRDELEALDAEIGRLRRGIVSDAVLERYSRQRDDLVGADADRDPYGADAIEQRSIARNMVDALETRGSNPTHSPAEAAFHLRLQKGELHDDQEHLHPRDRQAPAERMLAEAAQAEQRKQERVAWPVAIRRAADSVLAARGSSLSSFWNEDPAGAERLLQSLAQAFPEPDDA